MAARYSVVEYADPLDRILLDDEAGDFGIQQNLGSVQLGVQDVGRAEAERVYAAVGHPDGSDEVGIDRGFQGQGFLGIDDVGPDAGGPARFHELGLVGEVVFGQGDEESVRFVHAVAGDAAQDHVLFNAFGGGFAVGDGVPGAAVQQAVVASCGSIRYVVPLDEEDFQTPHGAVARRSGPGDASSDDDDIKFLFHLILVFYPTNIRNNSDSCSAALRGTFCTPGQF